MWHRLKNLVLENRWLFGVLLLTLGMLFYHISYRTFWMDETAVLAYLKLSPINFLVSYWQVPDNHPPLYYFLVLLVSKILPWNELAIRLVSILSGFGVVILVYLFTLKITNEKRLALVATFFTAFSSYFILISQMARYHSLAVFFALLTLYFFYLFLKDGNQKAWYYYLVALVFTAYSDYPQFFYVAVLTNLCYLYCLIRRQTPMRLLKWINGQFIAAIFCLPLVWMLYHRIFVQGDGGWSNVNLLGNSWLNNIGGIFFHFYVYFFGENIFPWNYLFFGSGTVVLLVAVVGLVVGNRRKVLDRSRMLIIIFAGSLIVLNTLFMNVADRRYNFIVYPKFGFVAYPLFVMSLVFCITSFRSRRIQLVIFMLWVAVSLYGLQNFYNVTNYLNPSYFRTFEAFEFVRDNSMVGQQLAITGDANDGVYNFYKDKYFVNLSPLSHDELKLVKTGFEVWFFSTAFDGPEASVGVLDRIPVGFEILKQFDSVPLDTKFKLFKERILRRPSYNYKYSVYLLRKI